MSDRTVVEWAPFTLAAGVSEERLLEASQELQEGFLASQPGFLRRELLRGPEGRFVDLVYWRDGQSARAAMDAAGQSPACSVYFSLMKGAEEAASGVLHFERAAAWE